MGPKVKIQKEQITDAAFEIVRKGGMDSLTAKSLAAKLKCSTQPIFCHYKGMNDLKSVIGQKAEDYFRECLSRPIQGISSFKAVGLNYIEFAAREKGLFKTLYMHKRLGDVFLDEKNEEYILKVMDENPGLDKGEAQRVFKELWIFSHGIASMIATETASFSETEIQTMLTDVYKGTLKSFQK